MQNNFNLKPNFPFTYGEDVSNDGQRLSDYVVNKLSEKETQNYLGGLAMAVVALGSQAAPVKAIPPEYGEAANEILKQAAQNGAVGGGVPEVPPIGDIGGHVPNIPGPAPGDPRYCIPAMPIEQQRLIAAQQAGQIGAMPGHIQGASNSPIFWTPKKPVTNIQKLRSTVIFIVSTAGICSQVGWNPIAQFMCAAGLGLSSYAVSKQVFWAIFKSFHSLD